VENKRVQKVLKKKIKRKRHLGHPRVNGIADHLIAVFLTPYDTAKCNGSLEYWTAIYTHAAGAIWRFQWPERRKLLLDASVSLDGSPAESPIVFILFRFHSAKRVRCG